MEQILVKPLFPQLDRFLAGLKPNDTTHEFIDGQSYQKPMPQGTTIHLQTQLWDAINASSGTTGANETAPQMAIAYPNHRCSFGAWSLVPTLAVFFDPPLSATAATLPYVSQSSLEAQPEYSVFDPIYSRCPDWMIEIVMPDYHIVQPLRSALHCLQHGTQVVWLIDPDHHLIFVFRPDGTPCEFKRNQVIPVPSMLNLTLTVEQVLGWIPARS